MTLQKIGFTLIELLVVITIIGLLSSVVTASLEDARARAKAARISTELQAIEQAFTLKILEENVKTWWHEDDFPSGSQEWQRYVQLLVDDGILETFLPVAPDGPTFNGTVPANEYFYDNDADWGDVFVNPSDCHAQTESNRRNNWDGVLIQFDIGASFEESQWQIVARYLDEAFDKSDGFYCGRFRADDFVQSRFFYALDNDQRPNF